MDLTTKTPYPVRINRKGRAVRTEVDKGEVSLRHVIDEYVRQLVYRDDADGVLKFGDLDYVMNRLKTTNPIFHTYRTIRDGKIVYFRLKIIPFDNGKKLVYGFEFFDDQMRDQLARRNEQEIQTVLLAGLSCEYECVWLVDSALNHGKLIRNNMDSTPTAEAAAKDSEGDYDSLIGNYIDRFVVEEDRDRMYLETSIDNLMRKTKEDEIYHINYARISLGGEKNYFQESIARVTDDNGNVHFVCGFRNIDALIEEEMNRNKQYSMAHVDHLTTLNNRRMFDEYMDSNKGTSPDEDLVFVSFDLNDIKEANDAHGHEAGDELIAGAADCIRNVFNGRATIFRTGGDEFAAILKASKEEFDVILRDLREQFAAWRGSRYRNLSVSIGYVRADEDPEMSLDDMRREAEKRMYSSKADYYMKDGNDRRRSRNHN